MAIEDEDFFDDDFDIDSINEDAITYACEDCDHRWEADDFLDTHELICPMCGSSNITEL